MRLLLVVLLLSATAASAQQQQTPSDLALQINGVIGEWARQLQTQQQRINELQGQLATMTKERDDLKAKAAPADQGKAK